MPRRTKLKTKVGRSEECLYCGMLTTAKGMTMHMNACIKRNDYMTSLLHSYTTSDTRSSSSQNQHETYSYPSRSPYLGKGHGSNHSSTSKKRKQLEFEGDSEIYSSSFKRGSTRDFDHENSMRDDESARGVNLNSNHDSMDSLKKLVNPKDYVNEFEQFFLKWIYDKGIGKELGNEILSLCKVYHIFQCTGILVKKTSDIHEAEKKMNVGVTVRTISTLLKQVDKAHEEYYGINAFRTIPVNIKFSEETAYLPIFNVFSDIKEMLQNPVITTPESFQICSSILSEDRGLIRNEIISGKWYEEAQLHIDENPKFRNGYIGHLKVHPLPLAIFIDGTVISKFGRRNATPIILEILSYRRSFRQTNKTKILLGYLLELHEMFPKLRNLKDSEKGEATRQYKQNVLKGIISYLENMSTDNLLIINLPNGIGKRIFQIHICFMASDLKETYWVQSIRSGISTR